MLDVPFVTSWSDGKFYSRIMGVGCKILFVIFPLHNSFLLQNLLNHLIYYQHEFQNHCTDGQIASKTLKSFQQNSVGLGQIIYGFDTGL